MRAESLVGDLSPEDEIRERFRMNLAVIEEVTDTKLRRLASAAGLGDATVRSWATEPDATSALPHRDATLGNLAKFAAAFELRASGRTLDALDLLRHPRDLRTLLEDEGVTVNFVQGRRSITRVSSPDSGDSNPSRTEAAGSDEEGLLRRHYEVPRARDQRELGEAA